MIDNRNVQFFEMAAENDTLLGRIKICQDSSSVALLARSYGYSLPNDLNMWAVNDFVRTTESLNSVSKLEVTADEAGTIIGRRDSDGSCSTTCQSVAHGPSDCTSCCD